MTYKSRMWMVILLLLTGQMRCQAQKSPPAKSVLDKGIRGTAYILKTEFFYKSTKVLKKEVSGSAFCVSDQGYYITNAHVVARMPAGEPFDIYIWTGPQTMWNGGAAVVYADKALDLALIKVQTPPPLSPFELGSDSGASPGMPVTAFGFPGHMQHPPSFIDRPPDLSVSTGRITQLYGNRRWLTAVETTTKVGHGSSGGPLLNRKGQVIGVIRAINTRNGHGLAISVNVLKRFLARPDIALLVAPPVIYVEPTSILAEQWRQKRPFVVSLRHADGTPLRTTASFSVAVTVRVPGFPLTHVEVKPSGQGVFTASFIPVPTDDSVRHVTLIVRQDGRAAFYYRVKDQVVQVGDAKVLLSDLTRIRNGDTPAVTFADGREQAGMVTGLDALELPVPAADTLVSLKEAQSISISLLPEIPASLGYHIQVTSGSSILAEKNGQIGIQGASPHKPPTSIIVACADEWPTNSTGGAGHASELTPSARQYIRNICDLFTGGAPGRFLICSEHWAFGQPFREALQEDGHTVTVALQPASFAGYEGVFVGNHAVPIPALIAYVQQGGHVYVAGGCSDNDAELWNPFLNAFGLFMTVDPRIDDWRAETNTALALFAGVKELKAYCVSKLDKLPGDWPNTFLTPPQFGDHLWAIYSPDKDVTAPLATVP